MSRPLRIEFAGALYHVMARGDGRREIFEDDEDREAFLAQLSRVCERFQWRLWTYCLMGNHYHLLVETQQPTLSRGMRERETRTRTNWSRPGPAISSLPYPRFRSFLHPRHGRRRKISV